MDRNQCPGLAQENGNDGSHFRLMCRPIGLISGHETPVIRARDSNTKHTARPCICDHRHIRTDLCPSHPFSGLAIDFHHHLYYCILLYTICLNQKSVWTWFLDDGDAADRLMDRQSGDSVRIGQERPMKRSAFRTGVKQRPMTWIDNSSFARGCDVCFALSHSHNAHKGRGSHTQQRN